MQAIGIVAEYNPFHNGHQYHIQQTKAQIPHADGVVAVMSGNFTQRGEPALFDKWTRAQAALQSGVDLVLELPTAFATRSAGYFARGAVLTLAATGIVNYLSCGVEASTEQDAIGQNIIYTLQQIASILADEPLQYQQTLQESLRQGVAYPLARQKALQSLEIPNIELLNTPNNILALEYLQNIVTEHLPITPVMIPRAGAYHDQHIPEDATQFASATAIRKLLLEGNNSWQKQMPEPCAHILHRHITQGYTPMQADCFLPQLLFLLRRSTATELKEIIEITEGLENRIYDAAHQSDIASVHDLCMQIKSKRYTYTRIQRTLLHILLNFTEQYSTKVPAYIRVLGFNTTGQKMLKEMKKTAELPILIRPARQKQELNTQGQNLLALDIRATNLYYMGQSNPLLRKMNLDLTQMPVQI